MAEQRQAPSAGQSAEGTFELAQNGGGALRDPKRNYAVSPRDANIPRDLAARHGLRGGESLIVACRPGKGAAPATGTSIQNINGLRPDEYSGLKPFEELTVVNPNQALHFETPGGPISTRIVDLV